MIQAGPFELKKKFQVAGTDTELQVVPYLCITYLDIRTCNWLRVWFERYG